MFWDLTEKLLAEGKFKVHTPAVGKDGLKGVLRGVGWPTSAEGEKSQVRLSETIPTSYATTVI